MSGKLFASILEAETSSLLFRAEYAGQLGEKTEELVCSAARVGDLDWNPVGWWYWECHSLPGASASSYVKLA